jgi:S1-C subfamily serine protease
VKHRARVHAVGHACDLAVLAVDDRSFWAEGADTPHPPTPLSLGDVPHLQDQVTVVGFPQGGDNLSITSGVVSRIELTNYAHGAAQLLAIQLDAAINPGNSGKFILISCMGN